MSFLDKIDSFCEFKHISITRFEHEAGLGQGLISKWRHTGKLPGIRSREKIAAALGVSADDLMRQDSSDVFRGKYPSYRSLEEFRRDCTLRYINVYRFPQDVDSKETVSRSSIVSVLPVPPGKPGSYGECFGLIIDESGMAPEIEPGDIVIVRADEQPAPEDTVIAVTPDGDVLCRKLIRSGDSLILEPYNKHFEPEVYRAGDKNHPIEFAGIVIALIRQFASPSSYISEW